MKRVIYFFIILFIIFLIYLAYCNIITSPKEGYTDFSDSNKQILAISGITSICSPNSVEYGNNTICYDISYVDPPTGNTIRTKAQIEPGFFINSDGLLQTVPYGYVASSDKRSYSAKTRASIYQEVSFTNTESEIANKIKDPENVIDNSKTSNKNYNSDNLDITYHSDPTLETQTDSNNLSIGQMWITGPDGNLAAVNYNEDKNTTHYYPAGSYIFNPPKYVPNYEESVFLSKMTNLPTVTGVDSPNAGDFCSDTKGSTIDREAKCNALDKASCRKSNCCVLLGGEKCVAGDSMGPTIKSNYSDITIINRDYYYYKEKCYGNC